MSRKPPSRDIDEDELSVGHAQDHAAGPTAVAVTHEARRSSRWASAGRRKTLLRLNQVDGFDCQGCAWPDPAPEHRHTAEFCENGAKAVTEEATRRHIGREFFAAHPLAELGDTTDYWLGQQGRIIEPMVLRPGASHYEPITWDDAFALVGRAPARAGQPRRGDLLHLRQDLQRGGVRLPAVRARLRHQQPARLLEHVPRVDLGRAGRGDRHRQGLGHPRRRPPRRADRHRRPEPGHQPPADALRAGAGQEERRPDRLDQPAARGRAGAVQEPADPARRGRPRAPRSPTCTCRSGSTATSRSSRRSARCCWSGTPSTTTSSPQYTSGFEEYAAHVKDLDWDQVAGATGLTREQIEECGARCSATPRAR